MNCPDTGHAPVSGISPPAAGLRSRTAAGLEEERKAILAMLTSYFEASAFAIETLETSASSALT